jgi:eukaryotic-like serine/threonine-protein kinase
MQSGPATTADPASMALGTILAGRYRLERVVGSGGFGTVFAAVNLNSGERVALKVLSPRVLEMAGGPERFRREADLARRLSHPTIVRVLDAGADNAGALFIAFELLEGRSLQEEIAARGAIAPRRAATIAIEVLGGLEDAHAHGVVHRDLKPANIFLLAGAREGVVKVLDFGIAKSTNPGTRAGLTQDGTALGTPAYMAPEQLQGGELRGTADLFSLGVVLAEMLVGRSLFDEHASAIQIITTRLTRGLPIPESILATPIGRVIAQATTVDPRQRFPDAAAMRAALESLLATLPSDAFNTGAHGTVSPTALGGAPTAAPLDATARSPAWAPAPSQVYVPQAPLATVPRKQSSNALWLFLVALAFAMCAVGGISYWALASKSSKPSRAERDDEDDRPRKKKKAREREQDETEETDEPETPPAFPPDKRPPTPPPLDPPKPPPPDPPAVLGRTQACKGLPLSVPALRQELTGAGFKITGTLTYCAGDMINFVCKGPGGDGFTVEGGDAALVKLGSAPDAESFAKKEAQGARDELTALHDGPRVLRVEMKNQDADRLIKRMCK